MAKIVMPGLVQPCAGHPRLSCHALRSGLLAASRRMAKHGMYRGLMVRDGARAPPHHEEILLGRPWVGSRIDRRRAAYAQNILQHLGAGEKLRLAARRR